MMSQPPNILTSGQKVCNKRTIVMTDELHDALEDLCCRFIMNIPEDDLESTDRVFQQIEQARWFYIDFFQEKNPNLPNISPKHFGFLLIQHSLFLNDHIKDYDEYLQAYNDWREYKQQIPAYGAIMLNAKADKCVCVKGCGYKACWGFPKGKINQNEEALTCAIREVREETGYDISPLAHRSEYIDVTVHGRKIRLYVVVGVPEDTLFATQTRKEISEMAWFPVASLPDPAAREPQFFMVTPFVRALRSWIARRLPTIVTHSSTSTKAGVPVSVPLVLPHSKSQTKLQPQSLTKIQPRVQQPKPGHAPNGSSSPMQRQLNVQAQSKLQQLPTAPLHEQRHAHKRLQGLSQPQPMSAAHTRALPNLPAPATSQPQASLKPYPPPQTQAQRQAPAQPRGQPMPLPLPFFAPMGYTATFPLAPPAQGLSGAQSAAAKRESSTADLKALLRIGVAETDEPLAVADAEEEAVAAAPDEGMDKKKGLGEYLLNFSFDKDAIFSAMEPFLKMK